MELIYFPEVTTKVAKDQPEYKTMPAHQYRDESGTITCCWRASIWERLVFLFTGRIWHSIMTFGIPLQPQRLELDKPTMVEPAVRVRPDKPVKRQRVGLL